MGAGNREKREDVAFDGKSVPTHNTRNVYLLLFDTKHDGNICC